MADYISPIGIKLRVSEKRKPNLPDVSFQIVIQHCQSSFPEC